MQKCKAFWICIHCPLLFDFCGNQIILSIEKSYMMGLGCREEVLKVFAEGNCAFDTVLLYFLKVYAFFLFNVEHVTQWKRDVELYWFNLL